MKVSVSEYAKRRGVSKTAVQKALNVGRITADRLPNGRQLIDPAQADVQWAAKTDPTQQHRGAPEEFAKTQALARQSRAKVDPAVRDLGFGLSLVEEKTRAERLRIRKQELELEQLEGITVSREAVVAALSTKLIAAGEMLQAIPDRFSALFAAENDADAIHRVLTAEIRAAMAAISSVPTDLH